jgi:hypothetical protein
MAISITALDSGAVKNDAGTIETQATNSVSPTAGKLYLIFVSSYGSTGAGDAAAPIGVAGAGLTFTLIKSVMDTGISAQVLSLWAAVGTPTTGAITIDIYDGRPAYFVDWSLFEVAGADLTSGITSAIPTARSVSNTDVAGTNSTLSISFTVAAGNGGVAGFTTTNTGTTLRTATPRTNWTEIHDVASTYATNGAEQSLETQYRATNENTASVTWSGTGYMYGIAAEIVASSSSSTTITPGVGSVTVQGRTPSTSAFNNVRIREVLVNASGQAVGSVTGINLAVWYGGIPSGAPDVSLAGLTTDSAGTTSWSIVTGTLAYNQPIFYIAYDPTTPTRWTCARMTPNYE